MTDKEKLIKLFDEFGIGYDVMEFSDGTATVTITTGNLNHSGHKKVTGYDGFATDFKFDENGKFVEADIYE